MPSVNQIPLSHSELRNLAQDRCVIRITRVQLFRLWEERAEDELNRLTWVLDEERGRIRRP